MADTSLTSYGRVQEGQYGTVQSAGPEKRSLSSWQQYKLVMSKNITLLKRDSRSTFCITLAPALIVLGLSMLSLIGGKDSYDMSIQGPSSLRDASAAAFIQDRHDDKTKVFNGVKDQVGDVLFAVGSDAVPIARVEELCEYVLNTESFYSDVLLASLALNIPADRVMNNTCGGGRCRCYSSDQPSVDPFQRQIFSTVAEMDAHALTLASTERYQAASAPNQPMVLGCVGDQVLLSGISP